MAIGNPIGGGTSSARYFSHIGNLSAPDVLRAEATLENYVGPSMLTQSQQDASFYGVVSGLLNQQEEAQDQELDAEGWKPWRQRESTADERRGFGRSSFACPQLVAPYDGKVLPSQASFRLVDCIDICSSGFSFLTDKIPDQQYLVIALGTVPFAFVTAEVLHIQRQEDNPAEPFRVGCQFLQRIPSKWTL